MPDTFGVMFVSREVLGSLVGKPDQINDIRLTLNGKKPLTTVMRMTSQALASYRPEEPVAREDQPSYQMLEQDVQGFRSYAVLFPAFFLSVAALAVYSLLLRMVHEQRPVIGLLRSLGFGRGQVIRHYLGMSFVVGLAGSFFGAVVGIFTAEWVSRMYMGQLQVPVLQIVPRYDVIVTGVLIGVMTCVVGGYFPALAASRIRPAEAMRPALPMYRRSWFTLDALMLRASLVWRIPLRNVTRQPRRTLSTLFGVVSGICLMILARGLLDSTEAAVSQMISGAYKYDLRVDFLRARTNADVNRVRSWPGVVVAEPLLEFPVEMKHGAYSYSALFSSEDGGALLHSLVDDQGRRVKMVAHGAVFGQTLRKRLHLRVGDLVEVRLAEQMTQEESTPRLVRVAGFVHESIGTVAYITRGELAALFRKDLELPPDPITGIAAKVAPGYEREVQNRLHDMTDSASVLSMPEFRKMAETMMKTVNAFVAIMELFGMAMAFAMIFNMVTINVLERMQEVATLRTIGVSRGRVALMLMTENMVVILFGMALGLPVGRWFVEAFWQAAQTEEQQDLFTFTIVVLPTTYMAALVAMLFVALVSQIPSLLALSRLNLAQAAKERAS